MARKLGPRRGCQAKEEARPTKGRATRANSWNPQETGDTCRPGRNSRRSRGQKRLGINAHKCLSATQNSGNPIRFFDAFSTRLGRGGDAVSTRFRRGLNSLATRF
ncbi:hypothetical protein AXF42_Ash020201 [Apostasia shenzhenica]|uniref:Uncharacterized protein n=1 Tax=Apostasia shenzhenica TaxID=1088818 RepID=A0A2H9ZWX0_9ASPA|nr:hypothetical protein AXF42_Ash020201 [Apostasia shenzhenica]